MKPVENLEKMGRQAWLAGLGLYGTGLKFTVDTLDKAYVETNSTVNGLISRGQEIQTELERKIFHNELLEKNVNSLKDKLGLNTVDEDPRLVSLTEKVEALALAVSKLVEAKQSAQQAAPKAEVKTATKAKKSPANPKNSVEKSTEQPD